MSGELELDYPDTVFAKACMWISIIIGTILGLVLLCAGGPSKVCGCFPYHKWIVTFFDKVVGPFFTNGRRSGFWIRIIVGWNELVSGCVILSCLWVNVSQYGGPDMVERARAWCMQSALLQVFMLGTQALMFYGLNGGNPGASGYTAGLMVIFLALRVLECPPWYQSFDNQVFIFISGLATPLPFLLLSWVRFAHGAPLRDLQPAYSTMKRPRSTLTPSPRYPPSQASARDPLSSTSRNPGRRRERSNSHSRHGSRSSPDYGQGYGPDYGQGAYTNNGYSNQLHGMPPARG